MLSGWLCLTGMVSGYYWFESVWNHHAFGVGPTMVLWMGCAAAGGAVFGTAGHLWRHRTRRWHLLGSALLSGVFLADGINMLLHLNDYRHMIPVPVAEIIVGSVLVLLLERGKRDRIRGYAALAPIVLLGLAGYMILFTI